MILFYGKTVLHKVFFDILRHVLKNMKSKTSTQMGHFRRFLPDVWQLRSRHMGKYVDATEREIIFWPTCSKLAVECAWKSKIPQNVRNLGLFWKNRWALRKKLEFFRNP